MGTDAPAGENAGTCPTGMNAFAPCAHGAIAAMAWTLTMWPDAKSSAWLSEQDESDPPATFVPQANPAAAAATVAAAAIHLASRTTRTVRLRTAAGIRALVIRAIAEISERGAPSSRHANAFFCPLRAIGPRNAPAVRQCGGRPGGDGR